MTYLVRGGADRSFAQAPARQEDQAEAAARRITLQGESSTALVQPLGPMLEGWRCDLVRPKGAEARHAIAVLRA